MPHPPRRDGNPEQGHKNGSPDDAGNDANQDKAKRRAACLGVRTAADGEIDGAAGRGEDDRHLRERRVGLRRGDREENAPDEREHARENKPGSQ